MEKQTKFEQWFTKMGYYSHIPESLENLSSNKSTAFIWSELIENAKPKQEVNNIRNNVIMNRLKNKTLNKQCEFSYPIKNIQLYIKKQSLEIKLNNLRRTIKEKEQLENNQSKNNKMKYIIIEKLKSKSKEKKIREFMLDKKAKMLKNNIQNAEETLNFAKNLTPVELDENPNSAEITDTLQKCAEKLEGILKDTHFQNYNDTSTYKNKSFRFYSAQKTSKTKSTLENYLIRSERKHSEKISLFKHSPRNTERDKSEKENLERERKVSKNLFSDSNQENKRSEKKRESLGILPDSYLNSNELIFVTETDTVEAVLTSNIHTLNEPSLYSSSPKLSFGSTSALYLNEQHKTRLNQEPRNMSYDKLYNNEFISEKLKNLLYTHNRQIIWNTFKTLNDNLNLDVTKIIILESERNGKNMKVNKEDIAKLQCLHIQTELQILKLKAVLKDMLNKIAKKKKILFAAINNKGLTWEHVEETGKLFETQLYDICLDVTLAEMKKEINSDKKAEYNNDLYATFRKTSQVMEDIIGKIGNLKQYINYTYDTLRSTINTRETTIACVRKLGPFVEDLTWSIPLTKNLCASEIRTFEKFPLEYNKRCSYTNPKIFYRDIMGEISIDGDLDNDTLYMLTNILESPFSPPETIVLHVLKCKMKLNALKSLPTNSKCNSYKKYSLKELQAQESYVQYALDNLNSIIFSASANKTLSTVDCVKNVMEIWLQMPLKDFISDKQTVNGQNYKFYEKQYDSFYKS